MAAKALVCQDLNPYDLCLRRLITRNPVATSDMTVIVPHRSPGASSVGNAAKAIADIPT